MVLIFYFGFVYTGGGSLSSPIPAEGAVPSYPRQPSLETRSLNTYPSSCSTSSMESRDGIHDGSSLMISPTGAYPVPMEIDENPLSKSLAKKQSQSEHYQSRKQSEKDFRDLKAELEETRKREQALRKKPVVRRPSYDMNANPHGTALVIVNQRFDKNRHEPELNLITRDGAKYDRTQLKITFEALKYVVKDCPNLTAQEMQNKIERSLQESETENADSFVCCVSTHGTADGLYGSDGILLKWEEIHALAIKYLRGKPKIFFFQSCRKPLTVKADGPNSLEEHEDSDIYKVYACTPNHEAYLSESGSWLATSLCRHFTDPQKMYTEDLLTIMNFVAAEVNEMVGIFLDKKGQKQHVRQCVYREDTLSKCVYFFPPQ